MTSALRRFLVDQRDGLLVGAAFGSLVIALFLLAWLRLVAPPAIVACPAAPPPPPPVACPAPPPPAIAPAATTERARLRDLRDPWADLDEAPPPPRDHGRSNDLRNPFDDQH